MKSGKITQESDGSHREGEAQFLDAKVKFIYLDGEKGGVIKTLWQTTKSTPNARISRKRLNEFAEKHPDTRSSLTHWYGLMKRRNFSNFAELRTIFPSADQVGKITVFNIGGNKVRLIAAIHYNRRKLYVRSVLTHAEYDKQGWKEYRNAKPRR